MTDHSSSQPEEEDERDLRGLSISAVIVTLCGVFWYLHNQSAATHWAVLFLVFEVATVSVVIWQACDPFADAAQWIGEALLLPGSVRGATLDAVASSMPELLSGIFFVVLALGSVGTAGAGVDPAEAEALLAEAGAEGFGATIATCAGSAVYNMILIPAFCALVISWTRPSRPTIDVEKEVISRDGMWFVGCQILLILFLLNNSMEWWMGLCLIGVYAAYVITLFFDAKKYRRRMNTLRDYMRDRDRDEDPQAVIAAMSARGVSISLPLVQRAVVDLEAEDRGSHSRTSAPPESAGIFFGFFHVPLTGYTACWTIIVASTAVAAFACYFLVDATRAIADLFAVPPFFVAVIVAAAASSVPDTLLAIGAARRGDDSGAVSNAFGSNIFDICICVSIPLLVNSYMTGWQPVSLLEDGKPIAGLDGLRILLVVFTIITLAVMWHRKQLTRTKAFFLCSLYMIFVGYAVLGSLGISLT